MISIRLNPLAFQKTAPVGKFKDRNIKDVVLMVGSGRNDISINKVNQAYSAGHLNYRGGQTSLMVDQTGTQLSDLSFEDLMQNETKKAYYGSQLIDMVEQGLVLVEQDGTVLTPTQINAFTA